MQVRRLDHVNIRTSRVETMLAWYGDILGLRIGPRPAFPFPGAWLYAEDVAIIHLVGHDGGQAVGSEAELKLEHFALTASGLDAFEKRLRNANIPYHRFVLDQISVVQFHLRDPDGNHVHVDFPAQE